MRDKMLGRWMLRLAVMTGAGAAALGVPAVAAYAGAVSQDGLSAVPGAVKIVDVTSLVKAQSDTINVTEDFVWG